MTWTSLLVAAGGVALFYLVWWLFSLEQRVTAAVDSSRQAAHAAGDLAEPFRARLAALEALRSGDRLGVLEEISYFDPLTQFRSGLIFRAELSALAQCTPLVLLYLDLDDFGSATEQDPHKGDRLLFWAAEALRKAIPRASDRLYRLHRGGEFAAILEGITEDEGLHFAAKALGALKGVRLSATIGLASTQRYGWRDLEGAADRACRQQRQEARGRCRIATEQGLVWVRHSPSDSEPGRAARRLDWAQPGVGAKSASEGDLSQLDATIPVAIEDEATARYSQPERSLPLAGGSAVGAS